MMEFFTYATSSPLVYLGILIIILIPGNIIVRIWKTYLNYKLLKTIGWPPSHIDANGEWKPQLKKDTDEV